MRDCHDNFLRTSFEMILTTISSKGGTYFEEINTEVSANVFTFVVNFSKLK